MGFPAEAQAAGGSMVSTAMPCVSIPLAIRAIWGSNTNVQALLLLLQMAPMARGRGPKQGTLQCLLYLHCPPGYATASQRLLYGQCGKQDTGLGRSFKRAILKLSSSLCRAGEDMGMHLGLGLRTPEICTWPFTQLIPNQLQLHLIFFPSSVIAAGCLPPCCPPFISAK